MLGKLTFGWLADRMSMRRLMLLILAVQFAGQFAMYYTTSIVAIGFKNDGEFYFASSLADGGDVLWLMELAKRALMDAYDAEEADE